MKVIDLLNKIANGEELPNKIKWGVHELDLWIYDYKTKDEFGNPTFTDLLGNLFNKHVLEQQIEILEESEEPKGIPEKLEILPDSEHYSNKVLYGKINEIIDCLEYLESKGE